MNNVHSTAVKSDIQNRLRRIEGQVRGVQRMIDEGRDCHEIVQQFTAIRSAVQNASALFMRAYAKDCLLENGSNAATAVAREALVDELIDLMARAG